MSNNKTEKYLRIINDLKNISGFLNVHKHKADNIKGFKWIYSYNENGKRKSISSTHLFVLKSQVISKGFPWKITDESKADESIRLEKSKYYLFDNGLGILFLDIVTDKFNPFRGFWRYRFSNDTFHDIHLSGLKKTIMKNNLPWIILDESNVELSFKRDSDFESGIEAVNKIRHDKFVGLFKWCYIYKDNDAFRSLANENLNILRDEVIANDLSWKIIDEAGYENSLKENKINLEKISHFRWAETGIYRVKRVIKHEIAQGFLRRYMFKRNGKKVELSSTNLLELK